MMDLSIVPSVDKLLNSPNVHKLIESFGRLLTLSAIREVQETLRHSLQEGKSLPSLELIEDMVGAQVLDWLKPSLIPIINATGVILHTNLGRAPLSQATINAMMSVSIGYSNLEYDLQKGKRGSRLVHAEKLLSLLTGAEAALVVNNNAGAVLLALSALAKGKKVLISRTQLVEIGGGFRIPDVMRQSGAKLFEIGTTNRTHLADYEQALKENDIAMVLIAHHSNFKLLGFTTEPSIADVVTTAHQYNVPVLHDLGSGALVNLENYGLAHETTVLEALVSGCDLVCFSGDKLLGGPQAGIIIGKNNMLTRIRKHPLARALRSDKLCLAGLSATLAHYLKDEIDQHIPLYQMLSRSSDSLNQKATEWREILGTGHVIEGQSTTGGGSLPEETLDTWLYALDSKSPSKILATLRKLSPPIIARIQDDQVVFDPRTILPHQEYDFISGLKQHLQTMK